MKYTLQNIHEVLNTLIPIDAQVGCSFQENIRHAAYLLSTDLNPIRERVTIIAQAIRDMDANNPFDFDKQLA
jgi:hypothetical protein